MRTLMLGAAAAVCLAGTAVAGAPASQAWLTLKTKTSTNHLIVDGAVWTCKVNVCRAAKVKTLPADEVCRQLASKIGEVTAFSYLGKDFTPEALAACNAGSKAG